MKRRTFLSAAVGAAMTSTAHGRDVFIKGRDVTYEPDAPLESTGLSITDGVTMLERGQSGNVSPVLREEILDNPDAVFIIFAGIDAEKDGDGRWLSHNADMQRFGERVAELVFRPGTERGGCTFIKPNMVGGINGSTTNFNTGGIVHPHFTCGMVDALRGMGLTNTAIAARGALRHNHIVESGLDDLLDAHDLPIIEAHVQYFDDYAPGDLVWHENPEGMVQRRFCTYKPAFTDGTRFINIAHAHTHKVGHTTLTMKNIQGIMPRGYGHICDAWTTLDMWRAGLWDDFNDDYREAVEKSWLRHGNLGYKYWDEGGFHRQYQQAGGYSAFKDALRDYRRSRGDDRTTARERCIDIADTRLFWAEIWAQRMMDIVGVIPQPYVNMVEGVFARGDNGVVHADFLTVGRSMPAVDSVASWLMGHDPREIPYLRIAHERGIGDNDISRIPIYILDESGVHRVDNPRDLPRQRCGIYNYGIEEPGLRFY